MPTDATHALNLDRFELPFFRAAVELRVEEYRRHFGDRLVAVSVGGSVHRNEAIPGISDIDDHIFVTEALTEADGQWRRQLSRALESDFPGANEIHPSRTITTTLARIAEGLQPDADEAARLRSQGWRLSLHFDATLVWGHDIVEGLPFFRPDRAFARASFGPPWQLSRFAAGHVSENTTEFPLPEPLPLRLRKLARLAVLGGACRLMAEGGFRSLRGTDVLPPLLARYPPWRPFLEQTRERYIQIGAPSAEEASAYAEELVGWMDWIGAGLADA